MENYLKRENDDKKDKKRIKKTIKNKRKIKWIKHGK